VKRSGTPLPSRKRKPSRLHAVKTVILVTNGREVQQNGRGRKGDRETTNDPVGETQQPLVTAMDDRFRNARAVLP